MHISPTLIVALRLALGVIFTYAGLSHLMTPGWSAAGFLSHAQTFSAFYGWLGSPALAPTVSAINEWALLLLGLSLLLGLFVRVSSMFGIILMGLYYFPNLHFPLVGTTGFLVDDHVIYILVLLLMIQSRAGRIWGLEEWCSGLPICARYPGFRKFLG